MIIIIIIITVVFFCMQGDVTPVINSQVPCLAVTSGISADLWPDLLGSCQLEEETLFLK